MDKIDVVFYIFIFIMSLGIFFMLENLSIVAWTITILVYVGLFGGFCFCVLILPLLEGKSDAN